MSRTNIDIDDRKLDLVMRRFGVRTKTEAVDMALSHLAGMPMTVDEVLGMHGAQAITEVPAEESPGRQA